MGGVQWFIELVIGTGTFDQCSGVSAVSDIAAGPDRASARTSK